MPQSLQPTGFVQPSGQKKNPSDIRLGYQAGTPKPLRKPTVLFEPIENVTPQELGSYIQEAEVGIFTNPYIFTTVDENIKGRLSSAFGPIAEKVKLRKQKEIFQKSKTQVLL